MPVGALKTPEYITIDGQRYQSLSAWCRNNAMVPNRGREAIKKGLIPGAIMHHVDKCRAGYFIPVGDADPNAFPALHLNSDGVPSPKVVDITLPTVKCSDCPHYEDKARRCYGLTRITDLEGNFRYYSCHRIGRKIKPLDAWINDEGKKQDSVPVIKTPQEKAPEALRKPLTPQKVETPKASAPENPEPIQKAVGESMRSERLGWTIAYLSVWADELEAEAEELENRFEALIAKAGAIKAAKAALEAVVAQEKKGVA